MPYTTERNLTTTGDIMFDLPRSLVEIVTDMIKDDDRLSREFIEDMHDGKGFMVDVLNSGVLDAFENDLRKAGVEYAYVERSVPDTESTAVLKKSIVFREQDLAYVELARTKANALSLKVHVLTPTEFKHTYEGKEAGKIENLSEHEFAYIKRKALEDNKVISAGKEEKETGIGRTAISYSIGVLKDDIPWLKDCIAKERFISQSRHGVEILDGMIKTEKEAGQWLRRAASLEQGQHLYLASTRNPNKYMCISPEGFEMHIRGKSEDIDRVVNVVNSRESMYDVKLYKAITEELRQGMQITEQEAKMPFQEKLDKLGKRIRDDYSQTIEASKTLHYMEALQPALMKLASAKSLCDEQDRRELRDVIRQIEHPSNSLDRAKIADLSRQRDRLEERLKEPLQFKDTKIFEARWLSHGANGKNFFGADRVSSALSADQLNEIEKAFNDCGKALESLTKERPEFQEHILSQLSDGMKSGTLEPVAERETLAFGLDDEIAKLFEEQYISNEEFEKLIDDRDQGGDLEL